MIFFKFDIEPKRQNFLDALDSIQVQIEDAYEEKRSSEGLTQSALAKRLGVHKSRVSRLLQGVVNMNLETLCDLGWELGKKIRIQLIDIDEQQNNSNYFVTSTTSTEAIKVTPIVNKPDFSTIPSITRSAKPSISVTHIKAVG